MADLTAGVLRVGNVVVDVRIRESHNLSMQLTQYAVESGKSISDHVISNPNEVEIEFEMTNTDGGRDRAKRSFQDFVHLMQARKPVDIITEHATYRNMVFVGFPSEHSAPNLGTLRGTARFQQAGILGDKNTVTAGRNERVLSGFPVSYEAVGAGWSQIGTRDNQDCTYRTGCSGIDSGLQTMDNRPQMMEKISSVLSGYSGGFF